MLVNPGFEELSHFVSFIIILEDIQEFFYFMKYMWMVILLYFTFLLEIPNLAVIPRPTASTSLITNRTEGQLNK